MLEPEIIELDTQYLIGMKIRTTLEDKSKAWYLWKDFLERVHEIKDKISDNFYSLHNYGDAILNLNLTKTTPFIKYAAVQVNPFDNDIPKGMEGIKLKP